MDDTHDKSQRKDPKLSGEHPSMRLAPIDTDEYDALAELFLGGELGPDPIDSVPQHDPEPSHDTHTPVLHLAGQTESHESELHADTANGVMESLHETDQHASALLAELMDQDEHDSFEFGSPVSEDLELIRMPGPSVEVVVLGHLPVRATLWARQYACASAKERQEVVALVRAAAGTTAIDLITGREPIELSGCAELDGAIALVHEQADRVILRVDERHEPDLLDRPEVETVTVLTGADEAAVVSSYRLIKTIDATLNERYDDLEDAPKLRIAVMGAVQRQAEDAREKLQTAVESFIERPVEIIVGSGRIDATGTTNIFRDARAYPGTRVIDELVELAHRETSSDHLEPELALVETRNVDIDSMPNRHAEPVAPRKPDTAMPASQVVEPKPIQNLSPQLKAGLTALIDGVRPIEARCPKAPGVEMGTDDEGRLHLLVCDADSDEALERLYAAQSWARDHLGLLLRAEPGLRFPSTDRSADSDAVMHLISHEPAALRGIYDTPVRMYALARVQMGSVIAQVATPLN